MLLNMLKQFNWLDIFILITIFRICHIAIKGGFTTELFKFLGTITAIYLSMHYSVLIADYIRGSLPIEGKVSLELIDSLVFLSLAILGYFLFVLLRNAFNNFVKIETVSVLNKWGGLILGGFRSVLLVSLISFTLVISSIPYFKDSVGHSYLGSRLSIVAPNTYTWIWVSIFSKFIPSEKEGSIVVNIKKELI
jgi:uncharacterized membrane protein required for colicin V production